ncbi:hypothetical protein POM88_039959 [Heracleum sosnowskyi]|uniref:Non-specific serine/threonine protein kinase n=1 Tax=Heracleum sosnowskyi TaxID=360622 RepID=A0AAD8M9U4_9APIA|nr:hypothetical protein POM88_039959 [Heracleum sosnowskyi]
MLFKWISDLLLHSFPEQSYGSQICYSKSNLFFKLFFESNKAVAAIQQLQLDSSTDANQLNTGSSAAHIQNSQLSAEIAVKGSIPGLMGNLSNLQYLNLSFNYFEGPIPLFVGSFKSLRYLDLSSNNFSGVIPHELQTLSKLQHLHLSNNLGLTSGENFEWLFNLSSLTHLDLSDISISPPSIWTSFIKRIPSILYLRLGSCNLSYPSLTFSNFSSSLYALHLPGNHINSSIFNWLSQFSESLVELDLG